MLRFVETKAFPQPGNIVIEILLSQQCHVLGNIVHVRGKIQLNRALSIGGTWKSL